MIVALCLAVLVGALAQSVSGIGFVLVCGPLLVAALGHDDGVRLGIVLGLVLNLTVIARHHTGVDRRAALTLLVPAVALTPLAALAVQQLPERAATVAAGLTICAAAAALARGLRLERAATTAGAVVTGALSTLMNVLAGVGGPAVALYASNAGWPQRSAVPTMQVVFVGLNVTALLLLGLPSVPGTTLVACLAALWCGSLVGHRVSVRDDHARLATLGLAALGGGLLVVRTLLQG